VPCREQHPEPPTDFALLQAQEVIVSFEGEDLGTLPFTNPLTAKDPKVIKW